MELNEINFFAIDFETVTARRIYRFGRNSLDYLCNRLGIPEGKHHRAGDDAEMCARLYLRELLDMQNLQLTNPPTSTDAPIGK